MPGPYTNLEDFSSRTLPRFISVFLESITDPYSYNPTRNPYMWFGFFLGLPVPVLTLWIHSGFVSEPVLEIFTQEPLHWFFALHPLFFAVLMGMLGSIHNHYIGKLHQQSIRDDLTGLYNHRYFREELEQRISEAQRYDSDLSLLMIDIDNFKDVNDKYGHPIGDTVLQELAELLDHEARSADLVCRYGGEEFAIILPGEGLIEAKKLAERLREKCASHDFTINEQLTISIGVGSFDPEKETNQEFILKVDKRLYHAKDLGRNRVCSSLNETTTESNFSPSKTGV